MTMRERMARAMKDALGIDGDGLLLAWAKDKTMIDVFGALTDAALDAMMKPTLEMAKHAPHYHDSQDGVHYMAVFQAMIRAAREGR